MKNPSWDLLFICLSLLSVPTSKCQEIEPKLCHLRCICVDRTVDCNQLDFLKAIPTNVPQSFCCLFIQHTTWSQPSLTRRNFTNLEHLQRLKIIFTNLQAVNSYSFVNMSSLRDLDLSYNEIKRLFPFTFYSLHLDVLYLEGNYHLDLSEPDVFSGMSVKRLSLKSIVLKVLNYASFSNILYLNDLYLYNNSLRTVDDRFHYLFQRPNQTLDLTNNPLQCACQLLWLVKFYKMQQNHGNTSPYKSEVNVTCTTLLAPEASSVNVWRPLVYRSEVRITKSLTDLNSNELGCFGSSINGIHVDVNTFASSDQMEVVCEARGNPPPKVIFHYPRTIHSAISVDPSLGTFMENELSLSNLQQFRESEFFIRSVRLNISLQQLRSLQTAEFTLRCISENGIQQPSELNFSFILADHHIQGKRYSATGSKKHAGISLNKTWLATKQFDLLELLAAILGTLIFTIIIFCVALYIIYHNSSTCCKTNKKYHNSSSPSHHAWWSSDKNAPSNSTRDSSPLNYHRAVQHGTPNYPGAFYSSYNTPINSTNNNNHMVPSNHHAHLSNVRSNTIHDMTNDSDLEASLLGPVYDVPIAVGPATNFAPNHTISNVHARPLPSSVSQYINNSNDCLTPSRNPFSHPSFRGRHPLSQESVNAPIRENQFSRPLCKDSGQDKLNNDEESGEHGLRPPGDLNSNQMEAFPNSNTTNTIGRGKQYPLPLQPVLPSAPLTAPLSRQLHFPPPPPPVPLVNEEVEHGLSSKSTPVA